MLRFRNLSFAPSLQVTVLPSRTRRFSAELFTVLTSTFLNKTAYELLHFLSQSRRKILNSFVNTFHTFPFRQISSYHLVNPLSIASRSALFGFYFPAPEVHRDFAELFECGFEVSGDFLHEDVRLGKIAGVYAMFLASRSIGSRLIASEISIMSPECQCDGSTPLGRYVPSSAFICSSGNQGNSRTIIASSRLCSGPWSIVSSWISLRSRKTFQIDARSFSLHSSITKITFSAASFRSSSLNS